MLKYILSASDLTDQREYERKEEAVMRERDKERESLSWKKRLRCIQIYLRYCSSGLLFIKFRQVNVPITSTVTHTEMHSYALTQICISWTFPSKYSKRNFLTVGTEYVRMRCFSVIMDGTLHTSSLRGRLLCIQSLQSWTQAQKVLWRLNFGKFAVGTGNARRNVFC